MAKLASSSPPPLSGPLTEHLSFLPFGDDPVHPFHDPSSLSLSSIAPPHPTSMFRVYQPPLYVCVFVVYISEAIVWTHLLSVLPPSDWNDHLFRLRKWIARQESSPDVHVTLSMSQQALGHRILEPWSMRSKYVLRTRSFES